MVLAISEAAYCRCYRLARSEKSHALHSATQVTKMPLWKCSGMHYGTRETKKSKTSWVPITGSLQISRLFLNIRSLKKKALDLPIGTAGIQQDQPAVSTTQSQFSSDRTLAAPLHVQATKSLGWTEDIQKQICDLGLSLLMVTHTTKDRCHYGAARIHL